MHTAHELIEWIRRRKTNNSLESTAQKDNWMEIGGNVLVLRYVHQRVFGIKRIYFRIPLTVENLNPSDMFPIHS